MVVLKGDRNTIIKALEKYNINYDPGPCRYVEIELDEESNKIKSVVCYAEVV